MINIVEGDEICYRCAFSCEKSCYKVITNRGEHDYHNKFTKTDITSYFKKKGKVLDVDYKLEHYKRVDPINVVKHTLHSMLGKLHDVRVNGKKVSLLNIYLSAADNFRYKIATIPGPKGLGYKAGRPEKPHHLQLCKDILTNSYGAVILKGHEADDALGLYTGKGKIISHIDKDMNSIEGWHYNHVTKEVYHIPEGIGIGDRGLIFFYKQLLTGDATDNIPGCNNPAKSHFARPPKISSDVANTMLASSQTEEQAFSVVADMYKHTYGVKWEESLKEVASLVWIKRKIDETGSQYLVNRGLLQYNRGEVNDSN